MAAKFVVFRDVAGGYRFHLKAGNGQVIATGEAYTTKKACLSGIDSIRRNATGADLEDRSD